MKTDNEELIRTRAYELWERAGRPEGDGLKHWFKAAEEFQSTKMDEGTAPAASVEAVKPAKAEKTRKLVEREQSDSTKPVKKTAASETPGSKKGKRPEGQ